MNFFLPWSFASPANGGSAEPREAIGASLRTQVRIFKPRTFAQILTSPVGRVWRLTHFCSVALLLEKWFACHHSFPYFLFLYSRPPFTTVQE